MNILGGVFASESAASRSHRHYSTSRRGERRKAVQQRRRAAFAVGRAVAKGHLKRADDTAAAAAFQ